MRSSVVFLCVAAEGLLAGTAAFHAMSSGWMPFSTDYAPRGYGAFIVLGMIACVAACLIAHAASRQVLTVAAIGATFGLVALGVAYVSYHARHPLVMIPDGFRGHLEPAKPFHEQLAFPCFITLGFVAAMFGLGSLELERDPLLRDRQRNASGTIR